MRKTILGAAAILALSFSAQTAAQKEIYIPNDMKGMDLNCDTSRWCYARSLMAPDVAIFWEKGFGKDLSKAPDLDGHNMKVDLKNLEEKLERFYHYYRDSLKFILPGSKAERYRMMVMLNYSLEGTAYGGDYDGVIGALWIAPNRVQDKTLNCIAHELGHSFQSQIVADGKGEAWGGGGIYEMTSQWMLWHMNPQWMHDEEYHWKAFMNLTHKAFLHGENIYHSPYVLEWWSTLHGLTIMGDMFRQGHKGEDVVQTYKRMFNLSQEQFCNEMFDGYRHLITYDMPRIREVAKPYANRFTCKLDTLSNGWLRIDSTRCPENYGFNAIALPVPQQGKSCKVSFKGIAGAQSYSAVNTSKAGWRYGFVAVKADGKPIYGAMSEKAKGNISFKAPKDTQITHLWLVVMGAPTEHWSNPAPQWDEKTKAEPDAQWPYEIRIH
jgi:hypothetical protein